MGGDEQCELLHRRILGTMPEITIEITLGSTLGSTLETFENILMYPSIHTVIQESGKANDLAFMADEHLDSIGPLQKDYGQLEPLEPLEPLFPDLPAELKLPRISYIEEDKKFGATVSSDFASGPGVNLEKYTRVNSFAPGVNMDTSLMEELEMSGRANSAPELTGGVQMDASMDMGTGNLLDSIKSMKSNKHFHDDDKYAIPKFGVGRRGSRESRSKTKVIKASKTSKPRSLSPNQKFFSNGKTKLSALRGMYPTHVRGVVESSDYDKDLYAGVVNADFGIGRLNVLDAVGVNVAKSFTKVGEEGGTVITPGKVVGQKHLKGRTTGVTYRIVFLNGTTETVNEVMLRHYASVFSSGCMRPEDPLLPIIVRMM